MWNGYWRLLSGCAGHSATRTLAIRLLLAVRLFAPASNICAANVASTNCSWAASANSWCVIGRCSRLPLEAARLRSRESSFAMRAGARLWPDLRRSLSDRVVLRTRDFDAKATPEVRNAWTRRYKNEEPSFEERGASGLALHGSHRGPSLCAGCSPTMRDNKL